ncbi:hypothetical protein [Paraburkholderia acidipaludis]|uniref:hypothetical protein n=1 Tax=Paraburkholderia acidipaludis TaxID=660537 RepID=UPI0005B909F3|nr:hypothetical protein [Paraburkholderia acidipaludis]
MADSASKMARLAEEFFGGLAKGVMVFVGVAILIVALLSGGGADIVGGTLPTTRKEWGYFLLIILISVAGFTTFLWLRRSLKF